MGVEEGGELSLSLCSLMGGTGDRQTLLHSAHGLAQVWAWRSHGREDWARCRSAQPSQRTQACRFPSLQLSVGEAGAQRLCVHSAR